MLVASTTSFVASLLLLSGLRKKSTALIYPWVWVLTLNFRNFNLSPSMYISDRHHPRRVLRRHRPLPLQARQLRARAHQRRQDLRSPVLPARELLGPAINYIKYLGFFTPFFHLATLYL